MLDNCPWGAGPGVFLRSVPFALLACEHPFANPAGPRCYPGRRRLSCRKWEGHYLPGSKNTSSCAPNVRDACHPRAAPRQQAEQFREALKEAVKTHQPQAACERINGAGCWTTAWHGRAIVVFPEGVMGGSLTAAGRAGDCEISLCGGPAGGAAAPLPEGASHPGLSHKGKH